MLQVEINRISLKKDNSEEVLLKDVDFSLNENEVLCILGENGSGKSTLIKSLVRLLDDNDYKVEGSIKINGKEILTANEDELLEIRKKYFGYVFQDVQNTFDPLKKLEYYFKKYLNSKEIKELFNYFLLDDVNVIIKKHPYELSGGMLQRLSLIFTLLRNPDIIILDEPTSNVDYPISNLILLKIKEFAEQKNKSVLIVTQDLEFAKKFERVLLIKNKTINWINSQLINEKILSNG
ncbi:MAG TPA: ATP-binding cassette domain-containing protein [Ignavibacteriaceae bacterium]|nr:ATP-binding cassette domain-containing protein [Ignavibacteriaceae bacterium]